MFKINKWVDSDYDSDLEDFLFSIRNETDAGHMLKVAEYIDLKNEEIRSKRNLKIIEIDDDEEEGKDEEEEDEEKEEQDDEEGRGEDEEEGKDEDDEKDESDESDESDEDEEDESEEDERWKGIKKKLTFSEEEDED